MAEKDEYDAIFAALKHPMRRRILFLLDEKGEVSFTNIQKTVGIDAHRFDELPSKGAGPSGQPISQGKIQIVRNREDECGSSEEGREIERRVSGCS